MGVGVGVPGALPIGHTDAGLWAQSQTQRSWWPLRGRGKDGAPGVAGAVAPATASSGQTRAARGRGA